MKAFNLLLAIFGSVSLAACSTSGNSHSQAAAKTLAEKTPMNVGISTSNNTSISNNNTTTSNSTSPAGVNGTSSTGTQAPNSPSNTSSAGTPTSNPQVNANTPPAGNTINNGPIQGMAYQFSSGSAANKIANAKVITLSTNKKEVLNVGGKSIDLAPEGLQPGFTFTDNANGTSLIAGTFVNYVDYSPSAQAGIYQNDNTTYVFTQGTLTLPKNMPTSGQALYTGLSSYHVTNATLNEQINAAETPQKWEIHGVMLTADFDQKTLVGDILTTDASGKGISSAEIDAKISGNTFSGEKNGTKNQGAFFGQNANEIGGIYINENKGFAGAFVAKSNWQ